MSKRFINILLAAFACLLLAGSAFLFFADPFNGSTEKKEPSIDDILEVSVNINDITTNLADDRYVKISFTVETDGKEAKKELEKRDFQVRSLIISELADLKSDELQGKDGKEMLEETMKKEMNKLMENGEIQKVYITSFVVS
jgi:flagellar FliL protein